MKKKILVLIILVLIIICGFIIWNNTRTATYITLDINPSIEINLNRSKKVKSIIALNEEAKEIVNEKLKGKNIDDTINIIIENLIKKGYANEIDLLEMIVFSNGKISSKELETKLKESIEKKHIATNIIIIDKISKEDKKQAKKYNVSPAKIAYIKTITNKNENINIEDLVNKSVSEVNETKEKGKYCGKDYILEGDWCLKEKGRISAKKGKVCPNGYLEYNGNCYEEKPIENTDKLQCREEFILKDGKCVRTSSIPANPTKYTCPYGEESTRYKAGLTNKDAGDANDIVCIDTSNAKHPVSPCETHDGTEYTVSGGKCYWHRAPVISNGCPGKVLVDGMCWDDASNVLICEGYRDGKKYNNRSEYCEHSINYIDPTITEYNCPKDYTLDNNKCLKDEIEEASYEQICPSGFNKVNGDRCINNNKTINKVDGFICEGENIRLKGNICIIYDLVEAKSN